jgi:hypothetical protein
MAYKKSVICQPTLAIDILSVTLFRHLKLLAMFSSVIDVLFDTLFNLVEAIFVYLLRFCGEVLVVMFFIGEYGKCKSHLRHMKEF